MNVSLLSLPFFPPSQQSGVFVLLLKDRKSPRDLAARVPVWDG